MAEGEGRGRAAGLGKLSLKRKRPPWDEAPPRRLQVFASNSPWFEKEGLSKTESAWVGLIKAVKPPLTDLNLAKVIKLPQFLEKSCQTAKPQSKPETFNVGTKQFEWVPFPLHHRDAKASYPKSHHDSANETTVSIGREKNKNESLNYISLVPEQKPLVANECAAEELKTRYNIRHSTQLEVGKRNKKCQQSHQQDIPGSSTSAAAPGCSKKFDFPECSEETIMNGGEKSRRELERKTSNDALVYHATLSEATPLLPAQESSASFSNQTKSGDDSRTSALDRCPICQMHFSGTLSELDLDSHLAKCLSESPEDVFW